MKKTLTALLGARPADTAGRAVLLHLAQHHPAALRAALRAALLAGDPAAGAVRAALRAGDPITHKQMEEMGWRRTDPRPWHKVRARWQHKDGWRLEHCGHQTALTPWSLYDPKGRMHTTGFPRSGRPVFGSAWPNLRAAAEYVSRVGGPALLAMDREEVEAPGLIRRSAAAAPDEAAAAGAATGAAAEACVGLHRIAEAQRSGQKCAVIERGQPLDESLARTCGVELAALIISKPNSDAVAGDVIAILQAEGVWTFSPSGDRILPGDVKPPKGVREADRIQPPANPPGVKLPPKVRRKAPSRTEQEARDQEAREEAEIGAAYRAESEREDAELAAEVRAVQAPYLASGHRLLRDGHGLVPGQRLVYYGFDLDGKIVAEDATFLELARPLRTRPQHSERMIVARTTTGRTVSGWPADFTAPTQQAQQAPTQQTPDDEWATVQSLPPLVNIPVLVQFKRSQGMWVLAASPEDVRSAGWQVVKTGIVWTIAIPPGPVAQVSRTELALMQLAPDLDALVAWAEVVHRYITAHPERLAVDGGRSTFKIGPYTYYPRGTFSTSAALDWKSPRFSGQIELVWLPSGGRDLRVRHMLYANYERISQQLRAHPVEPAPEPAASIQDPRSAALRSFYSYDRVPVLVDASPGPQEGEVVLHAPVSMVRASGWQIRTASGTVVTAVPPNRNLLAQLEDGLVRLWGHVPDLEPFIAWAESVHQHFTAHPGELLDAAGNPLTFVFANFEYTHRRDGSGHLRWRGPMPSVGLEYSWGPGGRDPDLQVRRIHYPGYDRFSL